MAAVRPCPPSGTSLQEIGILLPKNQRQHRTLLPYALC